MNRRELIVTGPAGDPLVAEQVQALRADPDGASERELDVARARGARASWSSCWARTAALTARWDNLVGVAELWAQDRRDAGAPARSCARPPRAPSQTTRLL